MPFFEYRFFKGDRLFPLTSFVFLLIMTLFLTGCSHIMHMTKEKKRASQFKAGTIIDSKTKSSISFSDLIDQLLKTQIIYVGEQHLNKDHHDIQFKILSALFLKDADLKVGMEMFDVSYQPILSKWFSNNISKEDFIKKSHWYANWRYSFSLYEPILTCIRENRIPLIALNVPFHIPPKVAVGGLVNLLPEDKKYLPNTIDLTHSDHKTYLKEVFERHPRRKGRDNFERFYEAQCLWEDAMAENISKSHEKKRMMVIIGNGHIQKKYGVPNRAFKRESTPFKTIFLEEEGSDVDYSMGDYIYITQKLEMKHPF